jgi:hypothetical protein
MHQSFRLNGSDYYTIFDLPIQVTNQISASNSRPSCDSLNNPLLRNNQINATGPPAILPYSVGKTQNAAALLQPQFLALTIGLLVLALFLVV